MHRDTRSWTKGRGPLHLGAGAWQPGDAMPTWGRGCPRQLRPWCSFKGLSKIAAQNGTLSNGAKDLKPAFFFLLFLVA